ncbi:MAG: YbaB/EbfC family nucleoid-associated protein [bacterium]|nr:YbaB/EbfC family nucleoid-associated protein [bacterium]
MENIFKQVQQMTTQMKKIQNELSKKSVTASVGGGMVEVTANGQKEIISIKIEKELINPKEKQMLEDLVCAGVNEALAKTNELVGAELTKLTGGMNILGLLKGLT